MSNKDLPENEKQKLRFERGNQITTYEREPTIWIEISQSELPEGISNQDILRVFDYRINNQGQSNNVTVIEESIIQEINTRTIAAQTEYLIDRHKYSKEAIKPYFLNYLDLEDKNSDEIVISKNDKRRESLSEEIEDNFNDSTVSSVSKVDAETSVTPKSTSSSKLQFITTITDQASLNAGKTIAGTLLKPLPIEEDKVVKAYALACDNLISAENRDIKEIASCNIKSSAGNFAEFIQNLVFDKVHCKESTTDKMSENHQKTPDVQNLVFDQANESNTPENSQQQPDSAQPISLTPENCCGGEKRRKPCDDDSDEVQIMCRKGDVKFKLRCKRIEGSTKNCDKVGNEIRYECEVVPERNQCIDKSILESCDLKCSLISAPPVMSAVPHNIKNDPTCPTCNAPMPPEPTSTIPPPPPNFRDSKPPPPPPPASSARSSPPPTPSSPTSKQQCSSPRSSLSKPTPNLIENENNNPKINITIKSNCENTPKDKSKETINTDINLKGTPRENTSTVDVKTLEKCENISEKVIFACRSKSKLKDCEELPPPPKEDEKIEYHEEVKNNNSDCEPGMLDDMKTAMTDAHCKTMATIRVAAEDLICSVGKTIGNSKRICEDPCSITKMKDSAEDLVCKLQRKAEEVEIGQKVECFMENSCKTIKKLQKCTRDAIKGATNQTKKALGYEVKETDDEEDLELRCKESLPCPRPKVKKTSCSNDDRDSIISEKVRESVESFYDDVCKSSQEAKDAVADLASQSLKILGLESQDPSFRGLIKSAEEETAISKVKKSAEELVYEVQKKTQELKNLSAEDRMKIVRESAHNMFEKITKTTEKIAECTQDACNEIASKSKKILGYDQDESELTKKREIIKTVISGLRLFQEDDAKEEKEQEPGILMREFNSTLNSIKASFEGFGNIEIGERSSTYDNPTPPKEVALIPSGNISRVSGIFASIKDRFFSMFYENDSSDTQSFSSESLTEDEIMSATTTTSNKRKDSDRSIESTDFFNRLAD